MIIWPGLRRSVSAIQRLFNSASFYAPLTHSLVPERGTGSTSFTRASAATVEGYGPTDNAADGLKLLTVAANEARFVGARRISEGVWSNTFADGSLIPAATNKGYLAEGARTQILATADIRDMTTAAWTLGATMTRARTSVGADGAANSATRLTGGAVAATNTCYTTIVAAASSRTYSALVKRVTGTGPVRIVQTGTETDISSQLATTGYALVQLPASVLNVAVGFKIDTNGDAIDVDFNQFEDGAFASSRIASAMTRAADVLTYPSAGNISGTVGAAYCEIKTGSICGRALSFNAGGTGMIDAGTGDSLSFRAYDETNVVNVTAGDSSASTVKQAIAWGGSTLSAARNGTTASGSPSATCSSALTQSRLLTAPRASAAACATS